MHFSLYDIHQAALNLVWEKEQKAVCKKKVWCMWFVWVNVLIEKVELTVLCLFRSGEKVMLYEERKLEM